MSTPSIYPARRDAFVWGITIAVLVVMAVVLVGIAIVTILRPGRLSAVLFPTSALIVSFILVFAYRYAPRAYRVTGEGVEILRPAGNVLLPLASIHQVETSDDWLGLAMEVPPGGNSGLFGIYGRFHRKGLGAYDVYGTRLRGGVLLRTDEGLVVITPDRRDRFIGELGERLGEPPGAV